MPTATYYRDTAVACPARVPLVAGERPARIPLSLPQQRLWFLNRLDPTADAYTIALSVTIDGPVDRDALRRAVLDVLERHVEELRVVPPSKEFSEFAPRRERWGVEQMQKYWLLATPEVPKMEESWWLC